jgi:hypothetical protein
MVCNTDEFRVAGRANPTMQGLQPERSENPQSSLVERVCAFLDRYACAHDGDLKNLRPAGPISAG